MLRRWLAALMVVMGVAVGSLMAQDDEGNLNDPRFNPRANACFEGGSLEFQCHRRDADFDGDVDREDINFMWWCGWFIIRVDFELFSSREVPRGCETFQRVINVPVSTPAPDPGPACEPPARILYFTVCRDFSFTLPCPSPSNLPTNDNPSWRPLNDFRISGLFETRGEDVVFFNSTEDVCPVRATTREMWDNFLRDFELFTFGWPE